MEPAENNSRRSTLPLSLSMLTLQTLNLESSSKGLVPYFEEKKLFCKFESPVLCDFQRYLFFWGVRKTVACICSTSYVLQRFFFLYFWIKLETTGTASTSIVSEGILNSQFSSIFWWLEDEKLYYGFVHQTKRVWFHRDCGYIQLSNFTWRNITHTKHSTEMRESFITNKKEYYV